RTVNMRARRTVVRLAVVHRRGGIDRELRGIGMGSPVIEEFDAAGDRDCPGCARRRRVRPLSPVGPRPAGTGVTAGESAETPQGWKAPLGLSRLPVIIRADSVERAWERVTPKVPYGVTSYWSGGYRRACSGYPPTARNPPGNERSGSPGAYAEEIGGNELGPGDGRAFPSSRRPLRGVACRPFRRPGGPRTSCSVPGRGDGRRY